MNAGIILDNELVNDKRVLREIKLIREEGHKVNVLCFGFRGTRYEEPENISITRIIITRSLKNILFFFLNLIPVYEWMWSSRIKKFIIKNNIEIIHSHDLYMSRASYCGIRKSGRSIPMILDLHENFPFSVSTYNWTRGFLRSALSRPGKWKKKEKRYLNYADRIIVLSEDFRDDLLARYPELSKGRFAVMPNIPDLAEAGSEKSKHFSIQIQKTAPVIFYFGIVAERRGIFDAIEVFRDLIRDNYKALFLIIGPADKSDRERFLKTIGSDILKKNVHYIPWIDVAELPAWLEFSDICIAPLHKNPQHESGVANKIYDYMLGGKPLVVSDCRPQKKLVHKHECGLVFTNLAEFRSSLISLLEDEGLRVKMGLAGKEAVLKNYSLDNNRQVISELYSQIL